MNDLAVLLLAVAIGDFVAGGVAGAPSSRTRAALGGLCAIGLWSIGAVYAGTLARGPILAPITIVALSSWFLTRTIEPRSDWAQTITRATPLGGLALAIGSTLLLVHARSAGIEPHPATSAMRTFVGLDLWLGIAALQASTANAVVREVLRLADVRFENRGARLRGGRYIGLFERWLIVGLAVTDLTAAALVVSAKSLLRFPELSSAAKSEPHSATDPPPPTLAELTEYFLLGSLVSWTFALVSVAILRLAI